MVRPALLRWMGTALMLAGLLTIVINAALTPFLQAGAPFHEVAASSLFLWRQSVSAAAAALLLFGATGLYLKQADHPGYFGGIAFVLALLGSALLLAWEWVDIFVLRDLALRAPEGLRALEAGGGTLYDLGALIPVTVFAIGWIALAAWTLRTRLLPRPPALLVIAGFFATPLLTAALPGMWGAALGNAILGAGWMWLGYAVRR